TAWRDGRRPGRADRSGGGRTSRAGPAGPACRDGRRRGRARCAAPAPPRPGPRHDAGGRRKDKDPSGPVHAATRWLRSGARARIGTRRKCTDLSLVITAYIAIRPDPEMGMRTYTYVIVGGGMTADAAVEGIRGADPAGPLALVGAEPHPPCHPPPPPKGPAARRLQGRAVVMLVPEAGLGAGVFPADLSRFLVEYYREKGVELRPGEGMVGLESRGGKCVVRTTTRAEVVGDIVVAGLGI